MTIFQGNKGQPVTTLDEWEALVNAKDWVDGRSAKRLAQTWFPAGGFPATVRKSLDMEANLANVVATNAVVEHVANVPGEGRSSSTDLMVRAKSESTSISIAVEAKVDEGFNQIVSKWLLEGDSLNSPANRSARVGGMARYLGLSEALVSDIRYQLIHRTYAAVVESETCGLDEAMLMIHSFSPDAVTRPGWDDFVAWARLLRDTGTDPIPDEPWRCRTVNGRPLWFLWVSDSAKTNSSGSP